LDVGGLLGLAGGGSGVGSVGGGGGGSWLGTAVDRGGVLEEREGTWRGVGSVIDQQERGL
jgi:hypothetical protein